MAKRYPKSTIVRQFSAGGVVYREDPSAGLRQTQSNRPGQVEWLLIKPSGKNQWRLPKGLIDKGETSLVAAQREVAEEGGIETEVIGKIGQDKYFYQMGVERFYKQSLKTAFKKRAYKLVYKVVTYYLMRYIKEAKGLVSWETEEVAWLPYEEAFGRLTFRGEKEMLRKARKMLELW